MATFDFPDLPSHFRQLLGDCRELYLSSGQTVVNDYPDMLPESPEHFLKLMDDLHQALLVKVFVTVCEADRRWSKNEKFLAEVLLFHLWSTWLKDEKLKEALAHMSEKALSLKWYALVRPFDQIAPLRNRVSELETIVTRLANVVARADGPMKPSEAAHVKTIKTSCSDTCEKFLSTRRINTKTPTNCGSKRLRKSCRREQTPQHATTTNSHANRPRQGGSRNRNRRRGGTV